MKKYLYLTIAILLITGCGSVATHQQLSRRPGRTKTVDLPSDVVSAKASDALRAQGFNVTDKGDCVLWARKPRSLTSYTINVVVKVEPKEYSQSLVSISGDNASWFLSANGAVKDVFKRIEISEKSVNRKTAKQDTKSIAQRPPKQIFPPLPSIDIIQGNYEQAYRDYQKSVAVEPNRANAAHLSNILYSWVISESEPEDIPLLNAQRHVLLAPQQLGYRQSLLSVAVDKEKDVIRAFGLGVAPENISHPAQRRLLARQAALTDSYSWVARFAMWTKMGVEVSLDVSRKVVGVRTLKEFWVGEIIYIIKVEAPLNDNCL